MTEYRVLYESEHGWVEIDTRPAASAEAAIRAGTEERGSGGRFVAIPSRSWRPVKVRIETSRHVRFEEPDAQD